MLEGGVRRVDTGGGGDSSNNHNHQLSSLNVGNETGTASRCFCCVCCLLGVDDGAELCLHVRR